MSEEPTNQGEGGSSQPTWGREVGKVELRNVNIQHALQSIGHLIDREKRTQKERLDTLHKIYKIIEQITQKDDMLIVDDYETCLHTLIDHCLNCIEKDIEHIYYLTSKQINMSAVETLVIGNTHALKAKTGVKISPQQFMRYLEENPRFTELRKGKPKSQFWKQREQQEAKQ